MLASFEICGNFDHQDHPHDVGLVAVCVSSIHYFYCFSASANSRGKYPKRFHQNACSLLIFHQNSVDFRGRLRLRMSPKKPKKDDGSTFKCPLHTSASHSAYDRFGICYTALVFLLHSDWPFPLFQLCPKWFTLILCHCLHWPPLLDGAPTPRRLYLSERYVYPRVGAGPAQQGKVCFLVLYERNKQNLLVPFIV